MTFAIGGSARVRKRQKEAAQPWECDCIAGCRDGRMCEDCVDSCGRKVNPGSLVNCPWCKERRP